MGVLLPQLNCKDLTDDENLAVGGCQSISKDDVLGHLKQLFTIKTVNEYSDMSNDLLSPETRLCIETKCELSLFLNPIITV